MALANFFDKTALGSAQVLAGFDRTEFEKTLLGNPVEIVFDKNGWSSSEGSMTLDLLTRLLARLYPSLVFRNPDGTGCDFLKKLEQLAMSINPKIKLDEGSGTVIVVVGNIAQNMKGRPVFYLGSKNWTSFFSIKGPVTSHDFINSFGAGAAACFGAANVFREIFKKQLLYGHVDTDFTMSMFSFKKNGNPDEDPILNSCAITDTTLAGVGAVGNAFLWTLSNLDAAGNLDIVDHQQVDLSNLQRYVLTDQTSITKDKVEYVTEFFKSSRLTFTKKPFTWQEYVQERNNWQLQRVAVAVDSVEDRIAIQGALPQKIFNAWTQPEALGVSRHLHFLDDPCLVCLYLPSGKRKSRSEEVAENLGLLGPQNELIIRGYLAQNKPVDAHLIGLIVVAKNVQSSELMKYVGSNINVFHSEVACGGVLMNLAKDTGDNNTMLQVPSAFESALAGIMLAAEIVIDCNNMMRAQPTVTRFNLMRPVSDYLLEEYQKHASGKCICKDKHFRNAYRNKYVTPHQIDASQISSRLENDLKEILPPLSKAG